MTEPEVSSSRKRSRLGIVIVDQLATIRAALSLFVGQQPDLEVIAQASTADEAIEAIKRQEKRSGLIVLLGLGLTGEHDSFWLIRTLRERFPSLAVVACGADADKTAISRALFVGADGFVDKNAQPEDFVDGLRRCAQGEVVMVGPPDEWIGPISEEIDRQRDPGSILTDREVEVLTLAAEGLTARQIGEQLGLRERTVTTHLGRIYSKLGVSTRIAAISLANKSGLIDTSRHDRT